MREILAVADLIPGDLILPNGGEVIGYPHGLRGLNGTLVETDEAGIVFGRFYHDSETQVQVLR